MRGAIRPLSPMSSWRGTWLSTRTIFLLPLRLLVPKPTVLIKGGLTSQYFTSHNLAIQMN
jgi:hypothetical protein